ncbi:MAG TPA: murein L,D-transpeptidase catalytic domain family protein [Cytophagaceae bacterium]|nr:murein L,D-transpeptidase catalytic domain family protein [Cytophagaceae bacterium]
MTSRPFILLCFLLAATLLTGTKFAAEKTAPEESGNTTTIATSDSMKTVLLLDKLAAKGLNAEVLSLTLKGYEKMKDSLGAGYRYLMIADFSKPSSEKRFYMIDLLDSALVLNDYVAHGKNSGNLYANEFSNTPHSCQSSLGFYKVSEPYYGQHGLSLRLDGLDKGFNCKARERAIVMHTADYARPEFIQQNGRMGRSFGCPVLPAESFHKISRSVSGNSLLFIYYPDSNYLNKCIWLD